MYLVLCSLKSISGYFINKIAVACVTGWVQYNNYFPLPQNSVPLLKKKSENHESCQNEVITKPILMKFKYNQSNLSSNIPTKFHQNLIHSNRDR